MDFTFDYLIPEVDFSVASVVSLSSKDDQRSGLVGSAGAPHLSAFDEYQSQENSKHTSRAMRENARQGFFNGSGAPFGYRAAATEALGNRGRRKRKLAIDEAEAAVVRRVFQLYLEGSRVAAWG